MVLRLIRPFLALLLAVHLCFAGPILAHKGHEKAKVEQAAQPAADATTGHRMTPAMTEAMKDHEEMKAMASRPWHVRLVDWVGRTHPFSVHFPIALFPIALLALILARRRGHAVDVIRSLIVVAGVTAAGAAVLGWLNAGMADPEHDPILLVHRWLGTALGLAGAGIAAWTWRRASAVDKGAMVWTLGLMTLALLVQGWYGGAMIHGIDHMNW